MTPIPEQLSEASLERRARKRVKRQVAYLKGGIRLEWLCLLLQFSAKTIATGLALAYKAGVLRSSEDLPLGDTLLERFHVSRRSAHRALGKMERAGLVRVKRHRGRNARVSLLRALKNGREAETEER